jgi:hypothetical protein
VRRIPNINLSLTLLALLALGSAACDSPLNPEEAGASQESTMAMFAEILDKLESIEDRIDSLEATVEASGGDGELVLTGLPAAQLDSVLVLASFLAEDVTSGGWEFCGDIGAAGEFGGEWVGEAEGVGAGHLGAWAGTGAYAGGDLSSKAAIGGALKVEGSLKFEGCVPLGGESPPVRIAPAGPAGSPELDQLRSTLTAATTQLGFNPARLTSSVQGVTSAVGSPGSLTLANVGDHLPLPPALASLADDPLGTVADGVQNLVTSAQSTLCTGGIFQGPVSTVIADACDVIDTGGLANITAFADMASTFPAVHTAVTTVCGRVNTIGLQRLIIPSWDVTFPLGIGTVEVFPGVNQRLFPAYTTFACP